MKQKGCLLLIILFVAFVVVIVLQLPKGDHYNDPYFQKIRTGALGKISFKGKVINYSVVHNEQFGKDYSVLCIKLDYSNTDSFYYFEDKNALRIKDGIATIPVGVLVPGQIPVYVDVNMNNNYKIIFHFADKRTEIYPLSFNYTGLSKEDLNYCD
jgi:hypothetical protein